MWYNILRGEYTKDGKFYCDESGATGTNWTDKDQPFLIYGGWLILKENEQIVFEGIKEIFKTYNGDELKSSRFLKMGKSTEYFKRLFDFMLTNECLPVFTVTNKLFITAAKLVETFFDPAYNSSLRNQISWDMSFKKELVNAIYQKNSTMQFSNIIRFGTLNMEEMHLIKSDLATMFESTKYLKENIENLSDSELQKMIDEFEQPNVNRSLTVPALNQLMQLLQKVIENQDLYVSIIHDRIRGYDSWLKELDKIYLSGKSKEIMQIGSCEWYSSMPNISNIVLVDSKDELFVQVADLLCGFTARCFKKIEKGSNLDQYEKKFLQCLLVLHDDLFSWEFVLSDFTVNQYFSAVGLSPATLPPINLEQLDNQFRNFIK